MLRSEDVLDDEVVGKARDGFARVGRVGRVSIAALPLFLSRASFLAGHRVGGCFCVRVVCASLCVVASENRVATTEVPTACPRKKPEVSYF